MIKLKRMPHTTHTGKKSFIKELSLYKFISRSEIGPGYNLIMMVVDVLSLSSLVSARVECRLTLAFNRQVEKCVGSSSCITYKNIIE